MTLALCGLLLLLVAIVFGQSSGFDFVNWDDGPCVYENAHVTGGLSAAEVRWAFTNRDAGIWAPLCWLSHMLDCQLYGLSAGGHHVTNVLLHAATAILLLLVLRRMTGRLWPSALAAAIFAVHPLRAESVAWVTERKDVLSGVFFMLTLWAYAGYAQSRVRETHHETDPTASDSGAFHAPYNFLARYLTVLVCFALGLMAKPSLAALPLLLPLLDYWPLRRYGDGSGIRGQRSGETNDECGMMNDELTQPAADDIHHSSFIIHHSPDPSSLISHPSSFVWLLLEKLPLVALAAAACAVTLWAESNALAPNEQYGLPWRFGNALISYVAYLGQFFYPVNLAVAYPRAGLDLPLAKVLGALLLLAAITAAALLWRRRRPYLLVGWAWYVVMLLPVIGLVQFGAQAEADRFTYLPEIGLCIALAWTVADACRAGADGTRRVPATFRRWAVGLAAVLAIASLVASARRQTSFWRNSETLWNRALACAPQNKVALAGLISFLEKQARPAEALEHYRTLAEIDPQKAEAENNLGLALARCGRPDEAIAHYRLALVLKPDLAEADNNWGHELAAQRRYDEAIGHYEKALRAKPDFAEARYNLGNALAARGRLDEAVVQYRKAVQLKPDFAEAHGNLGNALARQDRLDEAIASYRQALTIKPDDAKARNNLGFALAGRDRPDEAMTEYRRAISLRPDFADAYYNLGKVLAGRREFQEAIANYRVALELRPDDAEARESLRDALQQAARP